MSAFVALGAWEAVLIAIYLLVCLILWVWG